MNGIPLPSSNHLTGHNLAGGYNDTISDILSELSQNSPNMTVNEAYNHIKALTNQVRDLIKANPNMNLGQIADLIDYP